MSVDRIIEDIIKTEGGYVNDKSDLGGATNFGITETTARANGYHGDMRLLPKATARQIYLNQYWLVPKFDKVALLSEAVAEELCDTGVNMGVAIAKPMLQVALNLLNREQADYPDLKEDGSYGPATLGALGTYLVKRGKEGEKVLLKLLNILQGARYIEITKARSANEKFLYGWILNRVNL